MMCSGNHRATITESVKILLDIEALLPLNTNLVSEQTNMPKSERIRLVFCFFVFGFF